MLKLGGAALRADTGTTASARGSRHLYTVFKDSPPVGPARARAAWKVGEGQIPHGFGCYLVPETLSHRFDDVPKESGRLLLPSAFDYFSEGDIIRANFSKGTVGTLFRRSSPSNTLLVTEQCNHYCLMCSQPPKRPADRWLVEDAKEVVRMMPSSVTSVGISGGEPTLLGDDLLELLSLTRTHLTNASVDLLSNGRRFSDLAFAKAYAAVQHPRLTVGIPIYSDDPTRHDYIVQSKGAFDETIRGILNLKRLGQRVEIRVVLHLQSIPRLVELARYLARNLLFVDHVALMGLEMTGFTLANLDSLWIDPYDYRNELAEAVSVLLAAGIHTSVYNLPRCVVPEVALTVYRKSISDWKNEYLPVCDTCTQRKDCGGFFSSAVRTRVSAHIAPL